MTTDLNTYSGGSQYNPDDSFNDGSSYLGGTSTAPPVDSTTSTAPVAPSGEAPPVDTIAPSDTSDTQAGTANAPEAAIPKLDQPEVQQAALSNSAALQFMLLNNFMNLFVSGSQQNFQIDESALNRSKGVFDFNKLQSLDMDLNKQINDIISDSWKKFNEVNKELARRDQEYLKSNTYAYLEYIGSAQYAAKEQQREEEKDPSINKTNQSMAQFQAYLSSLPPNSQKDLIESVGNNKDLPNSITNTLLTSNLTTFGNAYQEATKDNLEANNAKFVLDASISNSGNVLLPTNLDNIPSNQIGAKQITDQVIASNNAVPITGIDQATIAAAAYLSALMVASPLILSAFQTVTTAKAEGKPPEDAKDIDFAKNYAKNISNFVNSDGFKAGIAAVVTQRYGESEQPGNDQKQELVSRLTVIMLAMALVLVNKAFSEGVGGKEIRGKIEDPSSLIDPTSQKAKNPVIGDTEYGLARDINTNLPKDADARKALLDQLEAYFDTSPSKDELVENNTALKGAFTDFEPNTSTEIRG